MNWKDALISGAIYIIGIGGIGLILFGTPGCSIYQELPGLCYTDKDGTYFCPKEEPLYIDPLNYDRGRNCLSYTQNNEEWRWCMDPDNDHIYDPYYQQRQDFRIHRKEFYKEKIKEKLKNRILRREAIA